MAWYLLHMLSEWNSTTNRSLRCDYFHQQWAFLFNYVFHTFMVQRGSSVHICFFLSWWKFSFLHFGKWVPKGLGLLYVDCPAVWSISFRTKGRRIVFLAFDPPTSKLKTIFSPYLQQTSSQVNADFLQQ